MRVGLDKGKLYVIVWPSAKTNKRIVRYKRSDVKMAKKSSEKTNDLLYNTTVYERHILLTCTNDNQRTTGLGLRQAH